MGFEEIRAVMVLMWLNRGQREVREGFKKMPCWRPITVEPSVDSSPFCGDCEKKNSANALYWTKICGEGDVKVTSEREMDIPVITICISLALLSLQ